MSEPLVTEDPTSESVSEKTKLTSKPSRKTKGLPAVPEWQRPIDRFFKLRKSPGNTHTPTKPQSSAIMVTSDTKRVELDDDIIEKENRRTQVVILDDEEDNPKPKPKPKHKSKHKHKHKHKHKSKHKHKHKHKSKHKHKKKRKEKQKIKNKEEDETDEEIIIEDTPDNKSKPKPCLKAGWSYLDGDQTPKKPKQSEITKKKQKKILGPKPPKRPASAYQCFAIKKRKEIKESEPGLSFGQTSKKVGTLWKSISIEDKKIYEEEAAKLKSEYEQKLENWKKEFPEAAAALEEDKKNKKGIKRKGKATGRSKTGQPKAKRGKTAYNVFAAAKRVEIKESDSSLSFGQVNSKLGAIWKTMSLTDRKLYQEKADSINTENKRKKMEKSDLTAIRKNLEPVKKKQKIVINLDEDEKEITEVTNLDEIFKDKEDIQDDKKDTQDKEMEDVDKSKDEQTQDEEMEHVEDKTEHKDALKGLEATLDELFQELDDEDETTTFEHKEQDNQSGDA